MTYCGAQWSGQEEKEVSETQRGEEPCEVQRRVARLAERSEARQGLYVIAESAAI